MNKLRNLFTRRHLVHLLIITVSGVLPFIAFPEFLNADKTFLERHSFQFAALTIFYSLNLFWFLPLFLFKGKYFSYIISLFSILIMYVLVMNFYESNSQKKRLKPIPSGIWKELGSGQTQANFQAPSGANNDKAIGFRKFDPNNLSMKPPKTPWFGLSIPLLIFIALGTTYEVILRSERQKRENEELQKEKAKAELSVLKFQMEPHFLFNSLNSIYSLALTKQPDIDKSILILSEMMRYILEEAKTDVVTLNKEIDYIANFISMQKLRLASSNNIKINFVYPEEESGLKIAPMILIPFIENAFKYGVSYNQPCEIIVRLSVMATQVSLFVYNYRFPLKATDNSTGIGLSNVKRRLQLLYPHKHKISIEEMPKNFIVNLSIETV